MDTNLRERESGKYAAAKILASLMRDKEFLVKMGKSRTELAAAMMILSTMSHQGVVFTVIPPEQQEEITI